MRLLTVIALIALLNTSGNGLLFGPPAPSPWFEEHIALQPFDLPPGVSVELRKNVESKVPQEYILLRNETSTPLYIAGATALKFDELSANLPEGTGFVRKIVNGQAYRWWFEWNKSSSSYYYGWFPPEYGREDAIWLYAYSNNILAGDALVVRLKPLNQFDGNRPQDVKVPDPQDAILPIYYGGNEIEVPITVFYTINLEYRPASSNIGQTWIGDDIGYALQVSCVGLALVMLLSIALFSTLKYRKRVKK